MSHYPRTPWGDKSEESARVFIRRHRKKILILLAGGVVLVIAALAALAIFFFSVVLPTGTNLAKQAVQSGGTGDAVTSFGQWIQQMLGDANLMQWITLLLQFSN